MTRQVQGYPLQNLPAGRPLPQIPVNLPVSHSQEFQLTSNPSNETYIGYGRNLFKKRWSNWIFLKFWKKFNHFISSLSKDRKDWLSTSRFATTLPTSIRPEFVTRYRRKRPKVDASIFDSALSHTRSSDAWEKREDNSLFTFGHFRLRTSLESSPVSVKLIINFI